ncbi:MAG: ATP-binding protein, partial [Solirubrobacteraceae bacterium]
MRYTRRVIDGELDELLPELPAIALEGAKGVGKTATAARRAKTIHALDRPGTLELALADPDRLLSGPPPILIDEWQRLPTSWDLVRRAVDEGRGVSRFLLTGSATPRDPGTHSGAGRIVRIRMRPLALTERIDHSPSVSIADLLSGARNPIAGSTSVGLEDYTREICASGLPGLRGYGERAVRAQLDGYIDQIVDRDFRDMNHALRNPDTLRNWMRAYAAATATVASYDAVRDAATPGDAEKPAKATVGVYREILERLWILDPVPAWLPTHGHLRRLGGAPRHPLVEPAR